MATPSTPVEAWLEAAIADAERRGLPELKPFLETMARSTAALRAAYDIVAARGSRLAARSSRETERTEK